MNSAIAEVIATAPRHVLAPAALHVVPVDDAAADLQLIVAMMDLTSLAATDTADTVRDLAHRAIAPGAGLPPVAAVCVYSDRVSAAVAELAGSPVAVASVAGGFPHGRIPLALKLAEARYALEAGATEIDMVLDRAAFRAEEYEHVFVEISAMRATCDDYRAHLKVILENGELNGPSDIMLASWLAMHAGAHFVKTSTGKIPQGASPEAVAIMLATAMAFKEDTGVRVGVKAAGGIRTAEQAVQYLALVRDIAPEWRTPRLFRFGASALLDDVIGRV